MASKLGPSYMPILVYHLYVQMVLLVPDFEFIFLAGGTTSIFEFISQTLGSLIAYISGIYVSSYIDVKN